MYVNDEDYEDAARIGTRFNSDLTPIGTSRSTVRHKVIRRHKDAIKQGDKVKALPYFHTTVCARAVSTVLRYKWGYVQNAYWGWYTSYVFEEQPDTPVDWSNPFFNSNSSSNEPMIFHGSYAAADMSALLKLRQQKLDIGTMVAELTETVMWFAGYARILFECAIAIKSGKYRKALNELGIGKAAWSKVRFHDASARFLEWKFAIMPLVHDIKDINTLIEKKLSDLDLLTVSVKGKESCAITSDTMTAPNRFYTSYGYKYKMTQVMRTKIVAKVNDLELLVQKSVGLNSYAVPAWEMIPYSWLVDYVFNVGDLLKASQATLGLSFMDGYQSTKLVGMADRISDIDYSSFMKSSGVEPKRIKTTTTYAVNGYVRRVLSTFPLPQVQFVLPGIKSGQVANCMALLHVLIATKSRYIPPQ